MRPRRSRVLGAAVREVRPNLIVNPATYPVPAARPSNSSLCTGKLETDFGLVLPDWRGGVECVIELLAFK